MKNFTLLTAFCFLIASASAQLVDGGFEFGDTGTLWAQSSTNFGTPLCTEATCGTCGGPCLPYEGDWYAWFGGFNDVEEGSVSQMVTIPPGTAAELTFQFFIANAGDSLTDDFVHIMIDGNMFFHTTAEEADDFQEYTLVTIDISQFADGADHMIMAYGIQSSAVGVNFLMDDFSMSVDGVEQVGINDVLNREKSVSMYPNPSADMTSLYFSKGVQGTALVTVYAMNGAIVSQEKLSEVYGGKYDLSLEQFEAGIYTVAVEVDGITFNEKLVVTK
jgi:hypothetical protein